MEIKDLGKLEKDDMGWIGLAIASVAGAIKAYWRRRRDLPPADLQATREGIVDAAARGFSAQTESWQVLLAEYKENSEKADARAAAAEARERRLLAKIEKLEAEVQVLREEIRKLKGAA